MNLSENALSLMLGHERYQAFPTQTGSFMDDMPLYTSYSSDAYVPYDAYINPEYADAWYYSGGADSTSADSYVTQSTFPDTKPDISVPGLRGLSHDPILGSPWSVSSSSSLDSAPSSPTGSGPHESSQSAASTICLADISPQSYQTHELADSALIGTHEVYDGDDSVQICCGSPHQTSPHSHSAPESIPEFEHASILFSRSSLHPSSYPSSRASSRSPSRSPSCSPPRSPLPSSKRLRAQNQGTIRSPKSSKLSQSSQPYSKTALASLTHTRRTSPLPVSDLCASSSMSLPRIDGRPSRKAACEAKERLSACLASNANDASESSTSIDSDDEDSELLFTRGSRKRRSSYSDGDDDDDDDDYGEDRSATGRLRKRRKTSASRDREAFSPVEDGPERLTRGGRVVCNWPGCGKRFTRSGDCKRHIDSSHLRRGGGIPCRICGKRLSRPDAVKRHIVSAHGGKPTES